MSAVPTKLPQPPEHVYRYDHLITEDNTPVESWLAAAQYRLLVDPLYASWPGPPSGGKYLAEANVGLFDNDQKPMPTVVPDMLLSLGVDLAGLDLRKKENRSYFIWKFGKPPDAVAEVVSDTAGGEDGWKLKHYAKIKVKYYIIFDPRQYLKQGILRVFALQRGKYKQLQEPYWLPDIGLGLRLWEGVYQERPGRWLRWCDEQGNVYLTGVERAEQERERAEQEHERAEQQRQRVERLAAKLRELGVDPDA